MAETVPTTREGLFISNHILNRMGDSRRIDHPDEPGVVLDTEFYWETEICLGVSLLGQTDQGRSLLRWHRYCLTSAEYRSREAVLTPSVDC
jgi:hypothetical protein